MADLKLFAWEGDDVFPVMFGGMICVLAHDVAGALQLIEQKYSHNPITSGRTLMRIMERFPHERYRIVEQPEAFALEGSDY